jgi:hypothetical protein
MSAQIDVVDISDNTNDNNAQPPVVSTEDAPQEEVKQEEVKPTAKAKPRAKAKAQVKEEVAEQEEVKPKAKAKPRAKAKAAVKEEVRTIADGATREPQQGLSSVKEEVKEEVRTIAEAPQPLACLASVKEEVKEEAKEEAKEEVKEEAKEEVKPKNRNRPELKEKAICPDCGKELTVHGLKYTHKKYCKPKQESPPPTQQLQRTVTSDPMYVEPTPAVPTDEQIAAFLLNQKKLRASKRREQMSSLVSKALPK